MKVSFLFKFLNYLQKYILLNLNYLGGVILFKTFICKVSGDVLKKSNRFSLLSPNNFILNHNILSDNEDEILIQIETDGEIKKGDELYIIKEDGISLIYVKDVLERSNNSYVKIPHNLFLLFHTYINQLVKYLSITETKLSEIIFPNQLKLFYTKFEIIEEKGNRNSLIFPIFDNFYSIINPSGKFNKDEDIYFNFEKIVPFYSFDNEVNMFIFIEYTRNVEIENIINNFLKYELFEMEIHKVGINEPIYWCELNYKDSIILC